MNFELLVGRIRETHDRLAAQASKAVNISLTIRNWLIGCYLVEFEQTGNDRAEYGARLLERASERLTADGVPGVRVRELQNFRKFYLTYPQIRRTLSAELVGGLYLPEIQEVAIARTLTAESQAEAPPMIPEAPTPESKAGPIRRTPSSELMNPPERLLRAVSYSKFLELIEIDDPLKRTFYEIECLAGNWSVRELKRQIASLYYERSGLSEDKAKLAALVKTKAEPDTPALVIRNPYVFEFLGLKSAEVMGESELEDALLDRIEEFLMELGRGFCFEARQKCILIGEEHYFVDLVLYHRILKCHVLIELKADGFKHEHIGQLNTYVNWYREHEMTAGDNPPVGILLCTEKNHALVKYALPGVDNRLFVSKYQLELPNEEEMRKFIEAQLRAAETPAKGSKA